MTCGCRKGSTCPEHLAEADLSLEPTFPAAAFYEERIRLVTEERDKLRLALRGVMAWPTRDEFGNVLAISHDLLQDLIRETLGEETV